MEKVKDFKELKSIMAGQPYDKKLNSYKNLIYPLDKIGVHKGIDQYFYYILDWQTRTYPFISSTWKEIIDYDENFWEGGLDAVLSVIHPEDAPALQSMLKKWIEFIKNETEESLNKHSVSFDFRVIKKNGEVINVIQQSLHTSLDNKGNIIYDLGMIVDISHYKNDGNLSLRITGPDGKRIVEYYPKSYLKPVHKFEKILSGNNNDFIDKIKKIIEENYYDNKFDIRDLSREMNMSRYQLHRKTKSLIDIPPNTLIRLIRLHKAARLLSENNLSISEIAYYVGYSSPTYFTKCFSEEFGYPPREHRNRLKKSE